MTLDEARVYMDTLKIAQPLKILTTASGTTTGRSYTAPWGSSPRAMEKMFINSRGQITVQAAVAYLSGIPFVKISVKHMQGTEVTWEHTFTKLETAPKNAREKSDLLRNMAMLHAMQLGYPHKLRSKV